MSLRTMGWAEEAHRLQQQRNEAVREVERLRATLARILDWIAPVQPAEPSWLDRADSPRRWDGCMVLACTDTATTERHGWRTCTAHAPASV